MLLMGSKYLKTSSLIVSFIILIFVCFMPVFIGKFLNKNRKLLTTDDFKAKFGNFYNEVDLTSNKKNDDNIYTLPMFLVRRIIFVYLPVVLIDKPGIQLQMFALMSTFHIIWIGHMEPLLLPSSYKLELFNQVMIMFAIYHMFCFSRFNLHI
jgi:hypothetical protein